MKTQIKKSDQCPNCQQALQGENFCPNCGQKNDNRRITLQHFVAESLSNFFALDGRFFHTVRNLFLKPGVVPKDFIRGKRQQYMNPIRMYFLSSLFLLFILQYDHKADNIIAIDDSGLVEVDNEESETTTEADSILAEFGVNEVAEKEKSKPSRISRMTKHYLKSGEHDPEKALATLGIDPSIWNRFLYTQSVKVAEFDNKEFSRFFASKLFWVLFLFLPILAYLLHLLYWRRKFYYPEHLFFTFYNQSAFFTVLSVGFVINLLSGWSQVLIVFILFFQIYLFLAMRQFYDQSVGKTLGKFLILNILTVPLFAIFFILAALLTFVLF